MLADLTDPILSKSRKNFLLEAMEEFRPKRQVSQFLKSMVHLELKSWSLRENLPKIPLYELSFLVQSSWCLLWCVQILSLGHAQNRKKGLRICCCSSSRVCA